MFTKLFVWLGKLSTAAKVIGSIIALCATLWGLKIGYDNLIITKHDREQEIIKAELRRDREFMELKNGFESFNKTVLDTLSSLSNQIQVNSSKLTKSTVVLKNLQFYMENKVATKDGLLEVQRVFDTDLKKNETSLYPTVLRLDNTSTLQDLK